MYLSERIALSACDSIGWGFKNGPRRNQPHAPGPEHPTGGRETRGTANNSHHPSRERAGLPGPARLRFEHRAGKTSAFSTGSNDQWSPQLPGWPPSTVPEPARSWAFTPNAFGLYAMEGNVAEMVNDQYDDGCYTTLTDPINFDPQGPKYQDDRTVRGGSFLSASVADGVASFTAYARTSSRFVAPSSVGPRVARDIAPNIVLTGISKPRCLAAAATTTGTAAAARRAAGSSPRTRPM